MPAATHDTPSRPGAGATTVTVCPLHDGIRHALAANDPTPRHRHAIPCAKTTRAVVYPVVSTSGQRRPGLRQLLLIRKDADGHWPLRPGIRARRLWRRHGGRSPREAGPRHCPTAASPCWSAWPTRGASGAEVNTGDGAGILVRVSGARFLLGERTGRAFRSPTPAAMRSASSACRPTGTTRRRPVRSSSTPPPRKGSRCSVAPCRPTTATWA